jgi:hypothetical protein
MERKTHWENIYSTKAFEEVSWYQKSPENAITALKQASLSKDAKIIDIGGGDSFFCRLFDRRGLSRYHRFRHFSKRIGQS